MFGYFVLGLWPFFSLLLGNATDDESPLACYLLLPIRYLSPRDSLLSPLEYPFPVPHLCLCPRAPHLCPRPILRFSHSVVMQALPPLPRSLREVGVATWTCSAWTIQRLPLPRRRSLRTRSVQHSRPATTLQSHLTILTHSAVIRSNSHPNSNLLIPLQPEQEEEEELEGDLTLFALLPVLLHLLDPLMRFLTRQVSNSTSSSN